MDELRATPAWVFDWELRAGTTSRIQIPLITYGAVVYEAQLPESDMVDREIYASALEPPPEQP